MNRNRLLLTCAPCLLALALPSYASSSGGAAVEEVVAGVDANLAAIQHGRATYDVRRVIPFGDTGHVTQEGKVTVHFDYPRLQYVWTGTGRVEGATVSVRTIDDGAYHYEFLVPWNWPEARVPGDACTVFIEPAARAVTHYLNPREQLRLAWHRAPSFADRLRAMQRDVEAKLTAVLQRDGLIRISREAPEGQARGNYWVSPTAGYCVVRAEEWPVWSLGSKPRFVYEASARDAGNGAFVLSHRLERSFVDSGPTGRRLDSEDEATLVELDLQHRPDEKMFTIDGLAIPAGARIVDKVHGREYRYGTDAVSESSIQVPSNGGPMGLRYWFVLVNLSAGALAVGWLAHRSKRSRRVARETARFVRNRNS